jgi:hypothetical protein
MRFNLTQSAVPVALREQKEKLCKNSVFKNGHEVIELNSLEDLIALQRELGAPIILSEALDFKKLPEEMSLEVYNDYRE